MLYRVASYVVILMGVTVDKAGVYMELSTSLRTLYLLFIVIFQESGVSDHGAEEFEWFYALTNFKRQ